MKMNYRTGSKTATAAPGNMIKKRASSRSYTSTVEYTLLSNLVRQQYEKEGKVEFPALLAIAIEDRIPGLIEKYGNKTMHQLTVMILKEFFATLPMPVYKRPSETAISVAACDIMLTAGEDYLALEDVMLFLQRARAGKYGGIKSIATTKDLLRMLELYREERHLAYSALKAETETGYKKLGPVVRIADEPTSIKELLHQGIVVDMTKKMSG